MPGDFETVKERIDIVALVGERVALKKAGKIYKGLCPFHGEKTPSFTVDPERRTYHCFGCSEHGDVFTWLEKMEHLEPVEALKVLAERAGVELTRRAPEEREFETRLLKVNETAHFYFRQALRGTAKGKAAAAYLERRGIAPETIERFGLGYAVDVFNGLLSYLKKKGFTEEDGLAAGVLTRTDRGVFDRFRDRLMVPIRDTKGRTIAFGGRAMRDDQQAKYVNTTNTPLFNKSETLYAFDVARGPIRSERSAVIVEGYFDAIACHQAGLTNVVASMGTALTQEQYLRLQDLKIERVVVAFDGDAAGQRSAERRGRELLPLLQRHTGRAGAGQVGTRGYATLYVTVLPEGKDPDDLARSDPALLRRLVADAPSLLEFLDARIRERSRLDRPEERLRYLDEVAAVLAAEPDQIRREVYVSAVAGSTGIDPGMVRARVEAAIASPARRVASERPPAGPAEPPVPAGRAGKQTPLQERYVMALLTRFPEEIARVDLEPDDLADPDLRDLLIHLQAGERPSSDLPAHLAAVAAALGASAHEPSDEMDPGQAIEIAAQRLRVQRLRDRLGEARARLARADDKDVTELAVEVERLATDLQTAMARMDRRTVLRADMERRESE
ncbi:MAG TPA: DNA primase [Candidatus Limnocylindria bacterium]|nr:DNA primase [Candidatus Limnocylindria bacterium]